MKKISLLLLLLVTINLSAQNSKDKGWYIQELHFPEITMPSEYKSYQINVNSNNDNIELIINKKQKASDIKNPNISDLVRNTINLIGFSKSEKPDFILDITNLGVKHIIGVREKTEGYGDKRGKVYTGIIEISSAIKLVVKDRTGHILFDKVYTQKYESENIGVYNNSTIKSSETALSEIKKQYDAKAIEYRTNKNINIADNVIRDISKSLKSMFSTYYENKRINLFLIKKEEKYGIQNNEQVEKLISIDRKQLKDYEQVANESLTLFENELNKITDKTNKNQKKIYWCLLSNLSGVNYALGNFDKAIEYAKLREHVDYNKKWRYNLEIAQARKVIIEKNKDFDVAEARKIEAPKTINIEKIGNYRNHTVSAVLEINTLNKLTEQVQLRDRALYYENQLFSTLIVINIPNHYKKSSKASADQLKEYQKLIKELRSNNTHHKARELFFKKYPYKTIHESIKQPDIDFMIKTYKFTEYETAVFTGILEKYYMIIQAYSYGETINIEDYDKKNKKLKEDINALTLSRNFTQPIETEILLSLEYMNSQKDTKKIDEGQISNILYNFKTYCSSFSL